jgi:hypothetical protein
MAKDGTDVMKPTTESRGARFEANTLLETRRSLVTAADPVSQNCC